MKPSLKGFSLIEVMIASTLLAMMGVMLFSTINSSINAKNMVEDISLRHQLARQALSRMAREISMSYLSKHYNKNEPAYVTQFKGYPDRLFFSAFGNLITQRDQKQSDQQVLGYFIDKDKEGRVTLYRKYHPNLNLDVEKGGIKQALLRNMVSISFLYYDDKNNKWDDKWISDPLALSTSLPGFFPKEDKEHQAEDGKRGMILPSLVKITLTIKMPNEQDMKWTTVAEIHTRKPVDLN